MFQCLEIQMSVFAFVCVFRYKETVRQPCIRAALYYVHVSVFSHRQVPPFEAIRFEGVAVFFLNKISLLSVLKTGRVERVTDHLCRAVFFFLFLLKKQQHLKDTEIDYSQNDALQRC